VRQLSLQDDHDARSDFVREIVQREGERKAANPTSPARPPKTIIQFWNNPNRLPDDVKECLDSWKGLEDEGFDLKLFEEGSARDYIGRTLDSRHVRAYDKCYHPAMQSDYFRLCYVFVEGGCYVDADDLYQAVSIEDLFSDGRLKIQPLCYDISTFRMVPPGIFTKPGANSSTWIFYFNNNPLIASREHPIVERALASATRALERSSNKALPDIQTTTGPGNLTKSVFDHARQHDDLWESLLVLTDWEDIAVSKWPLSYRSDARNWRISNRTKYRP
jgi:hypothetical protein